LGNLEVYILILLDFRTTFYIGACRPVKGLFGFIEIVCVIARITIIGFIVELAVYIYSWHK